MKHEEIEERLEKLNKLLIASAGELSTTDLAKNLGISRKQIYRDLQELERRSQKVGLGKIALKTNIFQKIAERILLQISVNSQNDNARALAIRNLMDLHYKKIEFLANFGLIDKSDLSKEMSEIDETFLINTLNKLNEKKPEVIEIEEEKPIETKEIKVIEKIEQTQKNDSGEEQEEIILEDNEEEEVYLN